MKNYPNWKFLYKSRKMLMVTHSVLTMIIHPSVSHEWKKFTVKIMKNKLLIT